MQQATITGRKRGVGHAIGLFLLGAGVGCGGGAQPTAPEPAPHTGGERPAPAARSGGMQVSGLMGTIPERAIRTALEGRFGSLARCFARGADEVEFLGGGMEFYFRVGRDGGVEWVYPKRSDVGHRETERCLLEVAAQTRFPNPRGGDAAEFAWSFEIDAPDGVRPPLRWDAARVAPIVRERAESLQACGVAPGALSITAYVEPGGRVLGAGASARSRESADRVDCAVASVQEWPMPDPGSYPAKVTFDAP